MKKYLIESIKCDVGEGGIACGPVSGPIVAEAKVIDEAGETFFMSLAEFDGYPSFYKTPFSTYDMQISGKANDADIEMLNEHFIETGEYEDIFEDPDAEWYPLFKLLIYVVRSDWDECESFIKEVSGKYLDELNIPMSDIEEEYWEEMTDEDEDEDEDENAVDYEFAIPEGEEPLYRLRMSLEADVATDSIFHDLDSSVFEAVKKHLQMVKTAVNSEDAYEEWKAAYIRTELNHLRNTKLLACDYMFAGIGQYQVIIPAEELPAFKAWINGNGSAFFTGSRAATEDEIQLFIALHANDEE